MTADLHASVGLGAILVVRDDRLDSRPLASGQFLARHAGVRLTVLETARRAAATDGDLLHVPIHADDPGAEVAEHANGRVGSVVLVGADRSGPLSGPLFDRTAEQVLSRTRRPVMVFGPGAGAISRPPTFVVAIDAACAAERVLPTLAAVLVALGGSLVIADLTPIDTWPDDAADPVADPARRVAAALADIAPASLLRRATWDVAGDLVDLVEPLSDAVLLVVATRWHDPGNHWYGTVRRLIRTATCPVLVVPTDVVAPPHP